MFQGDGVDFEHPGSAGYLHGLCLKWFRKKKKKKKKKKNIAIHVSNQLIAEAIYQLLVTHGHNTVVMGGNSPTNGFTPHVLLVDSAMLRHDLLAQYPEAKVLLLDTGIGPEETIAVLSIYKIQGVCSPPMCNSSSSRRPLKR